MFKFLREVLYYQPLVGSKAFRQRVLTQELLSSGLLHFLLIVAVLANAFGLLFPILGSNDANFYSVIAKNIALSGDWIDLTYANHDWLDKPHFPFWITALSYKLFGINAFAYVLPGLIFNFIGARYTFLIARYFYTPQTGIVAAIIYLTSLRLMLSAIDVRAEAYLLGEIIPACYYWLLYNADNKASKSLLFKGAVFTALAVMTKGIFVLLTIFSGLASLWIYAREWNNFRHKKWLYAVGLSLLFILPELICLVIQFDLHPEKVVFSQKHISAIKFFFWDSQFGRFFDTGPISSGHTGSDFAHYFYFIHTFLWAFLPWSLIFIASLYDVIKDLRISDELSPFASEQKKEHIYLLGSFLPTFILFSMTKFQLDYYINIIIPFTVIMCANWICNKATRKLTHPIFYVQVFIAYVLCLLVMVMALLAFNGSVFAFMLSLCVLCIFLFAIFINNRPLNKALVYPVLAISLAFCFMMLVNGRIYLKYDAGYNISRYLSIRQKLDLVDYKVNYSSLEFHSQESYIRIDNTDDLNKVSKPYYLVTEEKNYPEIKDQISNSTVLRSFPWIRQEQFIPVLFNLSKRNDSIINILLILVEAETAHEDKLRHISANTSANKSGKTGK